MKRLSVSGFRDHVTQYLAGDEVRASDLSQRVRYPLGYDSERRA